MASNNLYNIPNSPQVEDEEQTRVEALFNLLDLEEKRGSQPAFTRPLLQRISREIEIIHKHQDRQLLHQTTQELSGHAQGQGLPSKKSLPPRFYKQSDGEQIIIWEEPGFSCDGVEVNYMTRVELHPKFQQRFKKGRINTLRQLNATEDGEEENIVFQVPYHLESYMRTTNNIHEDAAEMDKIHHRITSTQSLWNKSSICEQLLRTVTTAAGATRSIKKIVCIGLGRLRLEPEWYNSALQHVAAFSLATSLDKHNRSIDPDSAHVQVILQDPCYSTYDEILLRELAGRELDFSLSDPETLLAIDENTLVMTAFLPITVPLMQILADLFVGGGGPALVLGDRMALDVKKEMYSLSMRDAPHVAKWIGEQYFVQRPQWVPLEPELRTDVGDNLEQSFWLHAMDIYVRKEREV